MSKIVLTGGGTAGHVVPNIALLPYLKKHFKEIHYIGSFDGIEKNIIKNYPDIIYHNIPTVKLIRSLTLKNLLIPIKLIQSIIKTKKILKEINPDVIFSKGGFVSVPVCFAASMLKIPIVAHESDFSMGLANKLIYKKCNKMCFSFKSTAEKYKTKGFYTGSPIKENLFKGNKVNIQKNFNLFNKKPTVLIIGGSLGAKKINEIFFKYSTELVKDYNIIHIVGKNNLNKNIKLQDYIQLEFIDDLKDFFAAADIVISRAGSNTIFELLSLRKLMILVPLPKDSSRGDQLENAEYFKNKNYAKVIFQENLNLKSIKENISQMINNKEKYILSMKNYNSKANQIIIEEILKNKK